jgi:hypothetical protein
MLLQRVLGVFRLSVLTFEDIEHDRKAIWQAFAVVSVVALAASLGSSLLSSFQSAGFLTSFIVTLAWIFISWFLWALATYLVGTLAFGLNASLPEMMRVLGFAYAPLVLSVIPCVGPLVGGLWALAAGFIAVRHGLDLDDIKTAVTILVGFMVYILGWAVVYRFLGLAF